MGRELSHEEVADLLGAYALDALDPAEHQAVHRHVEECPACQMEVAEHREVAGLLTPGWGSPPPAVWDRIAASLEETPPPLDMAPVIAMKRGPARATSGGARARRSLGAGIAAMVAVAAVGVVGFLGVRMVDDGQGPDYASKLEQSVDAALADPGARRVQLASTDGRRTAEAVVLPDGTGYLVDANLPALSRERTYQMWAVVGTAKISVGVLGPEPKVVPFKMDGEVSALAITEEVAGGVVSSRQDPVVLGALPRS
ncbi:MAG TPA: anti-sigma factor [Acidimicrobiales bacterium]|nr:anti-sigma factor [Acidimicrobiales bacterium]